MYFSGFADEAGSSIDKQIRATRILGWEYIEARNIDGINITDISNEKFKEVVEKLDYSGVKINCFGSTVANWGKNPRKDEDFKKSVDELKRAIPRMKKLGTRMLRGMSFAILKEEEPSNEKLEEEIVVKLKTLVEICEDAEIIYLHENCMNYFSQSYEHMAKLFERINSPALKVVFDTGNPVMADNRMGENPYQKQDSWHAYQCLKDHIYYVHIKDGRFIKDTDNIFPDTEFTFPGEGDGRVREIVNDLLRNGYDGGFSIEPHLASKYHKGQRGNLGKDFEGYRLNTYIEYGQRLMEMVKEIQEEINYEKNIAKREERK